MGELLTGSTIGSLNAKQMKEQRQRIVDTWSELGFLDGLSGHVNENIAQLYCCQASALINETPTGETKPMPIVKRVLDQIGDNSIVGYPNLPKDLHIYLKRDDEESEGTSIDGSTL